MTDRYIGQVRKGHGRLNWEGRVVDASTNVPMPLIFGGKEIHRFWTERGAVRWAQHRAHAHNRPLATEPRWEDV